jgi:DNA-binding transcriptional LysR family regulator
MPHDPASRPRGSPASGQRSIRAPSLDELETLLRCAAEGSLASASARLGISRPAVAKRIDNLEALAGRPLLRRAGQGVRLTDEGAKLVAAMPALFRERDALLAVLEEIRLGGERPAGYQQLLGHTPVAQRAAQRPEARLVVAEHLLDFVLGATSNGVMIADSQTSEIREANGAFCLFVGRARHELLGRSVDVAGISLTAPKRDDERLVDAADGARFPLQARRPGGEIRPAAARARLVESGGSPLLVMMVDEHGAPEPAGGD